MYGIPDTFESLIVFYLKFSHFSHIILKIAKHVNEHLITVSKIKNHFSLLFHCMTVLLRKSRVCKYILLIVQCPQVEEEGSNHCVLRNDSLLFD